MIISLFPDDWTTTPRPEGEEFMYYVELQGTGPLFKFHFKVTGLKAIDIADKFKTWVKWGEAWDVDRTKQFKHLFTLAKIYKNKILKDHRDILRKKELVWLCKNFGFKRFVRPLEQSRRAAAGLVAHQ